VRIDRELVERVEWSGASLCIRQTHAVSLHPSGAKAQARSFDRGALISFGRGSFVNRGIGIGLGGTPAAELVRETIDFYERLGLEPSLEVGAWVEGELLNELAQAGFVTTEFRSVYVRSVDEPPEVVPAHIEQVSPETAEARKAIVAHPAQPGTPERQVSDDYNDATASLDGLTHFVARVDGTVAACGTVTVQAGVAHFMGGVTLPRYRRRGLQSALLVERLRRAAAQGCDVATVTALPGSQSAANLERLGFELLYTQSIMSRPA
jgi:GNAT superfamily N-acetyltransferase